MSTPIYTDRDYLDEKFGSIDKRFDKLERATTQRMNNHDASHRRLVKYAIGIVTTFGAAVVGLVLR